MQENDIRITHDLGIVGLRVLALTLRRRYLLTFPVESAERMLNKGFKIIITNGQY